MVGGGCGWGDSAAWRREKTVVLALLLLGEPEEEGSVDVEVGINRKNKNLRG